MPNLQHQTNAEIALGLAHALRDYRLSPDGAALTQVELARLSGMGLTPLKRFEKTGAITLRNLIALLRALQLLDRLEALMPAPPTPGPLAQLKAARSPRRVRAPRRTAMRRDG
jgi:hypothetical protein